MTTINDLDVVEQLKGHVDFETAYVIEDYPYGGYRTQMKVWIETKQTGKKTKGNQRSMWCTLNPKTGRWNKPKNYGYHRVLSMFLDSNEHVQTAGISESAGFNDIEGYVKLFEIPEAQKINLYVCMKGAHYGARVWGKQTEEEVTVRLDKIESLIRYYAEALPISHEVKVAERDEALYMDDLKGTKLKKALGKGVARRVVKRYHNKNNTGGNFAVDIRITDDPNVEGDPWKARRYLELSGLHDLTGKVRRLSIGRMWKRDRTIDLEQVKTFEGLIELVSDTIENYAELD
jgi:hypothetical protein